MILAGDLDADPTAASIRFLTGRQALDGMSVCYRDAWESVHPDSPGPTYTPSNGLMVDEDSPFRRVDYVFVRCGEHGGPTLRIRDCTLVFDQQRDEVWASDHFGLTVDLGPAWVGMRVGSSAWSRAGPRGRIEQVAGPGRARTCDLLHHSSLRVRAASGHLARLRCGQRVRAARFTASWTST